MKAKAAGTTILIEPRMREQAIAARLDQFWTTEFSHGTNEQPQLTCEWPELLPDQSSPEQPIGQNDTAEAQGCMDTNLAATQCPPCDVAATTHAQTVTVYHPDGHNGANASGGLNDTSVPSVGGYEVGTPVRNWLDDVNLDRARIINSQNDYSQTSSSSARPPGQA